MIGVAPLDFDLVVYGGTSAGVATAIQGAKNGLRVVLLSPDKHIGGIQIEGLGATDIDNQLEVFNSPTLGGLALELHQRISHVYGRSTRLAKVIANGLKDPEVFRFEARVAEAVISEWLSEFDGITVLRGVKLDHDPVGWEGQRIVSLALIDGRAVIGKIFCDTSYEGDLLAAADISFAVGREARSIYGESLAGVREETLYTQFDKPIDPYIKEGDSSSGLLFGVSDEPFGIPGSGDEHLAAYSFRVPLTSDPSNRIPLTKPRDYRPSDYELHRRYARAGGKFYLPNPRLPGQKTDLIGSEGVLATDLLGMNDEWATGTSEDREAILREATRFTKGLLWFFASDPSLPAKIRNAWQQFGYCKDEFPDNEHFPRSLYIRDARRMISDYVITEHSASRDDGESQVSDQVAIAYWPTDTHCVRRIVRDGVVHNEGFIFKDGHRWRPFGISYRAMVPKRNEAINFLTPTCPSSSHVGYGAVRLEHQFYALGQACADAAMIAITMDCDVQDVPYEALANKLSAGGAKLDVTKVPAPVFPDEAV